MNNQFSWTRFHDDRIRREYAEYSRGCVRRMAEEWGVTSGAVRLRGIRIGAPVPRRATTARLTWWSRKEDKIILSTVHKGIPAIIDALRKAGYIRNHRAVSSHLHVLRLRGDLERLNDLLEDRDEYTPEQIAVALGMGRRTVNKWIERGWLPCRKCGNAGIRERKAVQRKDLRKFLIENVAHWNLQGADKYWLVDLLAATNAKHDMKGKAA